MKAQAISERKPVPRDADKTRSVILQAGIVEFARHGYGGATVERIVARAKRNERSLYYHFGSKEGLYVASLAWLYQKQMLAERELNLDKLSPPEAIRALVRFTWSYYRENTELLSLLNTENLYKAEHLKKSADRVKAIASPKMRLLDELLARGKTLGDFRADAEAKQVFLLISSLCYMYVSNRYTLSNYLSTNLDSPEARESWLAYIEQIVVEHLSAKGRAKGSTSKSTKGDTKDKRSR
jgi:AcrR family transcriptional regulator